MLMVFSIFGITNPLMAKIMPDILAEVMPEGMSITLAEPTAFDSWSQFFKNVTQMGFIVMVIVFSGILATELSKGTLINMLTKGLSRSTVILSKYTGMLIIWTVSITACFFLTWGYTVFLFPGDEIFNLLFSVFCLWLFGAFLLALLLFSSTLVKSNYGCMLITGTATVILLLLDIIPAAHKYNPLSLTTDNLGLITNTIEVSSLGYALLITGLLSLFFVAASVTIFRRKQL
jgi:ABC-2 type transport system permease protein